MQVMAPDPVGSGLEVEYAAAGAGSGSSGLNDGQDQEKGMLVLYFRRSELRYVIVHPSLPQSLRQSLYRF